MSSARGLSMTPDWAPFAVASDGKRGDPPRSVNTREGVGDRLRTAAFAELQAREAFHWAAGNFEDASEDLRAAWRRLAIAEERHLGWLLRRLDELEIAIDERQVSDFLWISLRSCKTACEFARYMAAAEERGKCAGERFALAMLASDPESARIFAKIAEEEQEHILLAERFYPTLPRTAASL